MGIQPEIRTELDCQDLLNSLEGVCYTVDFTGTIKAVGALNWNETANLCGARHLQADAIIGSNLFSHISGEDVIAFYRSHFSAFESGRKDSASFGYRCDTPDISAK